MAVRDVPQTPPRDDRAPAPSAGTSPKVNRRSGGRYQPLPTGTHGLDPALVKRDQRERLQNAMIELIVSKGYPSVRIADLAKLAHVSPPTFYGLYSDKEELFLSAYDQIASHIAKTVMQAYDAEQGGGDRLRLAMRAFAELAAAEPQSTSLLVLGAFGAGPRALERRRRTLEELETRIRVSRDRAPASSPATVDITVKAILGGIREVTAARLREAREHELPPLADALTDWAASYPRRLPAALAKLPTGTCCSSESATHASERARRAEGRLPSGRSDLPRQFIVKSQRERIVDATAAIVAEKGLASLTIPEIAKRANVSHQTFYDIYPSKHDAFLGAQKVGMHQALRIAVDAYNAHEDDWPRAIAAGVHALVDYLASEPAHAHLSLVDTFAASPEAIEIRGASMRGFAVYLQPGYELAAKRDLEIHPIVAEAITGGIWQVFHHYVENDRVAELPSAAPQLTYFALTPFLGPAKAAKVAKEAV
jgi:AcrR family transcriptional regulator